MRTKTETRQLYSVADLDSLVAGDRVVLDLLDFDPIDGNVGNLVPYAYCRRVGKKRIAFLQINMRESGEEIDEISAKVKDFSFDQNGVLVLNVARISVVNSYDSSSPEYQQKLALLKQAGLYK